MPLTGVYGVGGSGKTLITLAMLNKLSSVPKYANFNTKLPKWKKLDTLELFDLEVDPDIKTIAIYDEAYTEMDNRNSMSSDNISNSYLLFQARKNNMSFIAISQLNILDLRWRELQRYAIYCMDRPIYDKNGNDCTDPFKYWIIDGMKKTFFTMPYKVAKKIFPLYNTKEKIYPKGFDEMKLKLKIRDPKERNKIVDEIVSKIVDKKEVPEKVSHDWVKNAMMDLELQLTLEPFVYVRLRNR